LNLAEVTPPLGDRAMAKLLLLSTAIAAITGHASLSEVQRYTKAVDQKRLALSAMQKAK
jgi:hypothetical protein